ncbi:hypothetical protein AAG906_035286 [Vitis piasezkii]
MRKEILPLFKEDETQEAIKKESPKLILKLLPTNLVVISSSLTTPQEDCLLEVLRRCKKAIDRANETGITIVQNDKGEEVSTCLTSALCSPKQFKNEGELYIVHGKLWSLIILCLSHSKYARKEQWRRRKGGKENRGHSCKSQESNDSNHVRFGAEMRKIWPSEDNCIKLRDNFAQCEIGTPTCEM